MLKNIKKKLLYLMSLALLLTTLPMSSVMAAGTVSQTFDYTGSVQTFTAPYSGTYQLEVWGAQGGSGIHGHNDTDLVPCSIGGYGGYAKGNITLTKGETLYVVVGGQGLTGELGSGQLSGGYNGGGSAQKSQSWTDYDGDNEYFDAAGSGGGATHVAKDSGLLSSLSSNKSSVLIVAAGGGGGSGSDSNTGGAGGGATGGSGQTDDENSKRRIPIGGTQTAGGYSINYDGEQSLSGSFGQGGNGKGNTGGAGGGGYYGGGGVESSSYVSISGAGGSGYIGGVTSGRMETGVRNGNGLATITLIKADLALDLITSNTNIVETDSFTIKATINAATSYTWMMQPKGNKTAPVESDWVTISNSTSGYSISSITSSNGYYSGETTLTCTTDFGSTSAWYQVVASGDDGQQVKKQVLINVSKLECSKITASYSQAIEAGNTLDITQVSVNAIYKNGLTKKVTDTSKLSFVVNGQDVKSITPRHVSNNEIYVVKYILDGKSFTCNLTLKVVDTTAPVADTTNHENGFEIVGYTYAEDGSYETATVKLHATDNSDGALSYRIKNVESGFDSGVSANNSIELEYIEDGVLKIYISDPSGNVLQYDIAQDKVFVVCDVLEAEYNQEVEAGDTLSIKEVTVRTSYTDGTSEDLTGKEDLFFVVDNEYVETITPRHVSDQECYTVGYKFRGKITTCDLNLKVIDTTAPVADTTNHENGFEIVGYTYAEDGSYETATVKLHATDNSDGSLSYRIENVESGFDSGESADSSIELEYIEDGVLKIYISDPSGNVLQYDIAQDQVFVVCDVLEAEYTQEVEAGDTLSIEEVTVRTSYTDGTSEDLTGKEELCFVVDGEYVETITPRHVSDQECYTVGYEYRGKITTCDLNLKVIDTTAPVSIEETFVKGFEVMEYIYTEDGSYAAAKVRIHAIDNSDGQLLYRIINPKDNYDSGECQDNIFTLNYIENAVATVYVSDPSGNVLEYIMLEQEVFPQLPAIEPLPVPPVEVKPTPIVPIVEDEDVENIIVPIEPQPVIQVQVFAAEEEEEEEVEEVVEPVEVIEPQKQPIKPQIPIVEEEITVEKKEYNILDIIASPQFVKTATTMSGGGGGLIYFVAFWVTRNCNIIDAKTGRVLGKTCVKKRKHSYSVNIPPKILRKSTDSTLEIRFGKKFAKKNAGKIVCISSVTSYYARTLQEEIKEKIYFRV